MVVDYTGTGIKKDRLAKISEVGWTTKRTTGLGFGLFWAKDSFEGLRGRLQEESTQNQGTTFAIFTPTRAV